MAVKVKFNHKRRLKINERKRLKRAEVIKERKQLNEIIGGLLIGGFIRLMLNSILGIFKGMFGGGKFLGRALGLLDKTEGWSGLKSAITFFGKSDEQIAKIKELGILPEEKVEEFRQKINAIKQNFIDKVENLKNDLRTGSSGGQTNTQLFQEVEGASKQLWTEIQTQVKVVGKDPRAIKPFFEFKDQVVNLLNGLNEVRKTAAFAALNNNKSKIKTALSAARKTNVTDDEVDALLGVIQGSLSVEQSFGVSAKMKIPGKSIVEKVQQDG